jgi:hypothetical protein
MEGSVNFDPYSATVDQLIDAWLPLTFAFNSINRSMGLNDLYPFLLSPTIIVKLAYVCSLIQQHSKSEKFNDEGALKAMVAGLKKGIAAPT